MTEVALAEDNHVISALPPDRPDQPLCVSILPRRPRDVGSILMPMAPKRRTNTSPSGSIAVADEIVWSLFPSTGLGKLLSDPFRGS